MGASHSDTLESIRAEVVERLMEIRTSIDRTYARIPEALVRSQFDVVLDKLSGHLRSGDSAAYRGFVERWAAMREGEGFGPEKVIHSIVAIGDVIVRTAQRRFGPGERAAFLRAVTQATAQATRWLTEALAEELAERTARLRAPENA